ncbi:unnamed protein product [Rhizophagus irregularis]|nr:unnamed protein product [Rhizophagus irregularis]
MKLIKHQIFYFPEAKIRLESLYSKPNHGIAKLIEVQRNLKHFEWNDDIDYDYLTEDPYEKIFLALEKKADSLNYLRVYFQYIEGIDHILLQQILSKFYKLKILIIDDFFFFTEEQLEKLKLQVYNDLEILNIEWNKLNVISSIIENGGRSLKKILFRPYDIIECEYGSFNKNSLNFIRKIYENCPSIEYLSIPFSPSKEHFTEFEKLLKICKNLKSLLLVICNMDKIETIEEIYESGEILLKILIRSELINLKEIRFYDDFKFSLESLEEFLEKWFDKSKLSIFTSDSIYEEENYKNLINKYKRIGIIKDFKHSLLISEINYNFNIL